MANMTDGEWAFACEFPVNLVAQHPLRGVIARTPDDERV